MKSIKIDRLDGSLCFFEPTKTLNESLFQRINGSFLIGGIKFFETEKR